MGDTDGENGPPAIEFSADLGLAIEALPDTLKPGLVEFVCVEG